MKKLRKHSVVMIVIAALLVGTLPIGQEKKSQAANSSTGISDMLQNPQTDSNGNTTWSCVYFGDYWQNDTNGDGVADKKDKKEPVKWRVLSVDGDDVFLLADKNLDGQQYNDTKTDVTWETCTMRSWLNGYGAGSNKSGKDYSDDNFLDNAFSGSEQSAIRTTNVVNDDNPAHGTEGGSNTSDKVYLLSIDEVTNPAYGFSSDDSKHDESRKAKNTEYTKAQGTYTATDGEYAGNGNWWLRSPGHNCDDASYVGIDNYVDVDRFGDYVYSNLIKAARPALHLSLSSALGCSYAGTVSSDGTVMTPEMPQLQNPQTDSNGNTTWSCVYFGNYWQEDTNGDGKADKNDAKQPIKWRVLSVEGDDVFLLADKNLDCQKYNDTYTDVTWETCTMRSWLNGYGAGSNTSGKDYNDDNFLDNAFSGSERLAIRTTNVVNDDNPEYGTEGGNNTSDKVYLLSIDDVTNPAYGFPSNYSNDDARKAKNTKYVADGGEIKSGFMFSTGNADYWWPRSPGIGSQLAASVDYDGRVGSYGNYVSYDRVAVRPALHLNLSSDSSWSYAGRVTSDSKEIGTVPATPQPEVTEKPDDISLKNPSVNSGGVTTWDCVYFGNYWQEDTNGDGKAHKNDAKQPIKWRVLSVDGDDAFLLADKNLDVQQYNKNNTDVTWKTCTMRSWLNGYGAETNEPGDDFSTNNFLDNAFSGSEQRGIRTTNVVNNDNPEHGTEGGNDTSDKVYLLSIDEVTNPAYGFPSDYSDDDAWKAKQTKYTADGGEIKSGYMGSAGSAGSVGCWWFRSPGEHSDYAAGVDTIGIYRIGQFGYVVNSVFVAVRPALHLNLSSALGCSYAGTVSSDGTVTAPEMPRPDPTTTPTNQPGSSGGTATAMPRPDPTTTPTNQPGSSGGTATAMPRPDPTTTPTNQPGSSGGTVTAPPCPNPTATPVNQPGSTGGIATARPNTSVSPGASPGTNQAEAEEKIPQNIYAKSLTKTYGSKPFILSAVAEGDGELTYKSSSPKVATISPGGQVSVKGYGKTVITIHAEAVDEYMQAEKKITLTVIPRTVNLKKAGSSARRQIQVVWTSDRSVTGYQVYISKKRDFSRETFQRSYGKSKKKFTLFGLRSKQTYYVKIRAYRKAGKTKYYGNWSKVKAVKVK